jgi:hypothetical protein
MVADGICYHVFYLPEIHKRLQNNQHTKLAKVRNQKAHGKEK